MLSLGDDALQLVEAALHLSEAESGILLLLADALQLLLSVLFSDAGTLLPLLDALRKDLIDPAANGQISLTPRKFSMGFFFSFFEPNKIKSKLQFLH